MEQKLLKKQQTMLEQEQLIEKKREQLQESFFFSLREKILTIKTLPMGNSNDNVDDQEDAKLLQKFKEIKEKQQENQYVTSEDKFLAREEEFRQQETNYNQDEQKDKKSRSYLNIFGLERGQCIYDNKCQQYRGCFNIEKYKGIDIFQCLNCKYPMNSHLKINTSKQFSNLICKHLNRRYIRPINLNYKAIVSIFNVNSELSEQFDIDVEALSGYLNEGGYNILSYFNIQQEELIEILMKKTIMNSKNKISKLEIDEYFQFLHLFLKLYSQSENYEEIVKVLTNNHDIQKAHLFITFHKKCIDKIKHLLNSQILVFLITSNNHNPYTDFFKFMNSISKLIPDMQFFYSSKNKLAAIKDTQLFFPNFFKSSVNTFILCQQNHNFDNDKSLTNKEDKKIIAKINDQFKDLLDFNNFQVFRQDFSGQENEKIKKAFSFVNNIHFLSLCTVAQSYLIKIACKIGPNVFSVLSGDSPNYYRFSNDKENQRICDELFTELYINQRVLLIIRPIVVKSEMDEVVINTFRINGFTIIKRIFHRFTTSEALILGMQEKISEKNIQMYISMMTDGLSELILISRPGAFYISKMLSIGCEGGLRIKQGKTLKDAFVEHKTPSGMVFKEKLQLNFSNYFKNFTEANIFQSIRDIFDLEQLVLQENMTEQSQNVFMDDDDESVFLAQENEIKNTTITEGVRQQIVKELMHEKFNFYMLVSEDELVSEKLISLLIPECNQVEGIFLLVKPIREPEKQNEYLNAIKKLILRMNFQILEILSSELSINANQLSEFTEMLSFVNLNSEERQKIGNTYLSTNRNDKDGITITILNIFKPAGYQEMKQFLSQFSLETIVTKIPHLIEDLKECLIPCWNIESRRFASKQINKYYDKFDGRLFLSQMSDETEMSSLPRQDEKVFIMNYILMVTFGIQMDTDHPTESLSENMLGEQIIFKQDDKLIPNRLCDQMANHLQSRKQHFHLKVQSKTHGPYEIRVRILKQEDEKSLNDMEGQYQLISWYYNLVNQKFKQRCPLSYQYRIFDKQKAQSGEFDQVFDCQEYSGKIFIFEIYHQLYDLAENIITKSKEAKLLTFTKSQEQQKMKMLNPKMIELEFKDIGHKLEQRISLFAFFWGIKLAVFCKELEQIKCTNFENGYGKIQQTQKGFITETTIQNTSNQSLIEYELAKYQKIRLKINYYISQTEYEHQNISEQIKHIKNKEFKFTEKQNELIHLINFLFSIVFFHSTDFTAIEEMSFKKKDKSIPYICEIFLTPANLALIPSKFEFENLRIINVQDVVKYVEKDTMPVMDCLYETKMFQEEKNGKQPKSKKQEKKQKPTLSQPLNNYCLNYIQPEIRPKYYIVARLIYLLEIELMLSKKYEYFLDLEKNDRILKMAKRQLKKEGTTNPMMNAEKIQQEKKKKEESISSQYENLLNTNINGFNIQFHEIMQRQKTNLIDNIIKGFYQHYFLDEQDLNQMQLIYKENQLRKNKCVPDLIYSFVFLNCLDKLDELIEQIQDIQNQIVIQKKELTKIKDLITRKLEYIREGSTEIIEIQQRKSQLEIAIQAQGCSKDYVFNQIQSIFKYISSEDFSNKILFNYEHFELNQNQLSLKRQQFNTMTQIEAFQDISIDGETQSNFMSTLEKYFNDKKNMDYQKEFINRKKYFQSIFEEGKGHNQFSNEYTMDYKMQEFAQTQQKEIQDKIELEAPYLKNIDKDQLQQQWLKSMNNDEIAFKNIQSQSKKSGIYIDNQNKVDKQLDDKIDKVIKRFMSDKMNNFKR